jgi:hypothetical protein
MEEQAYGYERAYSRGMWDLQQGQALEALGVQKNRLAQAYNADISAFNLGVQGRGLQEQAARASLADGAGMALAQQGAGGTRGSDALQMRIGFQEEQFDDIGREVDSWKAGGYRQQAKSLSDVYARQMHGLKMQGFEDAYKDAGFGILDFLASGLGGAGQGLGFGMLLEGLINQRQQKQQWPEQLSYLEFKKL